MCGYIGHTICPKLFKAFDLALRRLTWLRNAYTKLPSGGKYMDPIPKRISISRTLKHPSTSLILLLLWSASALECFRS